MITFQCDTRQATATSDDAITTGSVGIPVALNLGQCRHHPRRRASLFDMHQKYSSLHANGFIDGYMARVASLPDREI